MKIYTSVVSDIETGQILESESFDYQGPLALAGGGDMMGDLSGVALDDPAPEVVDTPDMDGGVGDDDVVGEVGDIVDEPGADEPEGQDEPEQRQSPQAGRDKDVLPAELSKQLRQLKSANAENPEALRALKEFNNSYYSDREFKKVFSNPDEARTIKAALDGIGGVSGIQSMRSEIRQIEAFDEMAAQGDPKVMDGLFQQFPDGAKKLVPVAIQKLASMDPAAYRETMRSPLLQMLEGDGVIDLIGGVMDELKAAGTDPNNLTQASQRSLRELGRIAQWYNNLKQQETEFKSRYKDPAIEQLNQRNQDLRQRETLLHKETVTRDLRTYRNDTMKPEISKLLQGKTISANGRNRFEQNVIQEIASNLRANPEYNQSMADYIARGQVEQAVAFAKPYIDVARKNALSSVYTDLFGSAPTTARPQARRAAPQAGNGNGNREPQRQVGNDKPIPVAKKPSEDQINWDKDPSRVLYIAGKAYLKSGKLVSWNGTK